MARKANISREEIIEACWKLLESNQFPNIPRLAAYFLELDGRKCSNTTLLNGVGEWEELYREHKKNELSELDSLLDPTLKRFSRDVTQTLAILLDEKTADIEKHFSLKDGALSGKYLSLSSVVAEQENELEKFSEENAELIAENRLIKQELAQTAGQLESQLAQGRVQQSQIAKQNDDIKELNLNLSQREVDLAKQDAKLESLIEENERLRRQVEALASSLQTNNRQNELLNGLLNQMGGLKEVMSSLEKSRKDKG